MSVTASVTACGRVYGALNGPQPPSKSGSTDALQSHQQGVGALANSLAAMSPPANNNDTPCPPVTATHGQDRPRVQQPLLGRSLGYGWS